MLPQEVIRAKREGLPLSHDEIRYFVEGVTTGAVNDAQIAAFAMATFFKGMTLDEVTALTLSMRDSGDTLRWPNIDKPIVDKHSTGGVGDNVSLILAPLVAACGVAVPMISGRGLGHTGGTLDKLQSIAGYQIEPDHALLQSVIRDVGCAIVGPTGNLAPADKRIYAVRDVTATVDILPLITASILAKKLAAGLDALVLDVKCGSGAFMQSTEDAKALASSLVTVANAAGLPTGALITDMNEPLANCAGNALEIRNCLSLLSGDAGHERLWNVTQALAVEMLISSGLYKDGSEATLALNAALTSGRAMERFAKMVSSLGGPANFIERSESYLTTAPAQMPIKAKASGWLASCDAREIGMAVVRLGGGRSKPRDAIEHSVGLSDILPLGRFVNAGDPIAIIHGATKDACCDEVERLASNWTIADHEPSIRPAILSIAD
jgi:thymidine phosphorylase